MNKSSNTIQFLASLPPILSAIKVGQDGMRVQLDISETEMGNAVRLVMMRGVVFRVTIEMVDSPDVAMVPPVDEVMDLLQQLTKDPMDQA